MQVFRTIDDMRAYSRARRAYEHTLGFVPTMGSLHEGHLSLVDRAVEENDQAAMSIFVNPTQFAPNEDFDQYPRDPEGDLRKAEMAGIDAVFMPDTATMYGNGCLTSVVVGKLPDHLCGISRGAAHFRGVATVVCKLLNIVEPDRAYFGQKDAQQALIINRMVRDLNMPIDIRVCPTVREEDGLALSSRNAYLTPAERDRALCLYRALATARDMLRGGERASMVLLEAMTERIMAAEGVQLDYLEIVDPETLEEVAWIDDAVLMAGAIEVGQVRLIDNLLVHPDEGPWET